jgi:hypothetical protein
VFSLQSFAATMYRQSSGLAERLWGDVWFSQVSKNDSVVVLLLIVWFVCLQGSFSRSAPVSAVEATRRSFVMFVLEPLYKIYSLVVSSEHDVIKQTKRQENKHNKFNVFIVKKKEESEMTVYCIVVQ